MKVLILNQVFYPDRVSTAQHLVDLARHLTLSGCEVTVLAGKRDYENRHVSYASSETFEGIEIVRAPYTWFGKKTLTGRVIDSLTLELSLLWKLVWLPRHDVTISLTSPPLIGVLGYLFTQAKGGRLIQWMMDVNTDTAAEVGYIRKNSLAYKVINAVFEFVLRKSDQVVVLDRWMKKKMIRHGADPDRLVVVPPWPVNKLDTDSNSAFDKEDNEFAKEHGLQGKCVILYSGNHSILHPLETLLQAALAMRKDKRFVFLFIGAGIRVKDVSDFMDKHNLDNIIQLPSQPRERLDQTLAAADLHAVVMGEHVSGLVHTSKIYGVLSTGKPYVFIGPKESHVADLIEKCPHGFHVEHHDLKSLIRLIRTVPTLTPEQRLEFKNNQQYLKQHFNPETCMNTFARVVMQEQATPFVREVRQEFI